MVGVESGELAVRLVEAAEMAKASQSSVSTGSGSLAGLSDHRKGKDGVKLEKRAKSSGAKKTCVHCGNGGHGSGLQERRDAPCPAFSIKCQGCGNMGHFAKHCDKVNAKAKANQRSRSTAKVSAIKDREEDKKEEEATRSLGSLSQGGPREEGGFFALSGNAHGPGGDSGVVCGRGDDGPCFGMPDPRTVQSVTMTQSTFWR